MELRTVRIKAKLTQKQVAHRARVTERMYQCYEYGEREPRVRKAIRIAQALNKNPGDMERLFGSDASNLNEDDSTN